MTVHAFGIQIRGEAGSESDLDLTVPVAGYADPLALWDLTGSLANLVNSPVDFLVLRAAYLLMQYQVIATGQWLWAVGVEVGLHEFFVLRARSTWTQPERR